MVRTIAVRGRIVGAVLSGVDTRIASVLAVGFRVICPILIGRTVDVAVRVGRGAACPVALLELTGRGLRGRLLASLLHAEIVQAKLSVFDTALPLAIDSGS